MGKEQELRGRRVAEPKVPQSVVDDFEDRHRNVFDLERDDHEWRNTWRYKHDHVQSHWAGWRDCYLYTARRSSDEQAEVVGWVTADILAAMKRGERVASGWKRSADFCIPLYASPPAVAAGGVTEARAIVDEMLARDKRNGFLTDWWRIKLDALNAALPTPPSRGEGV